MKLDMVSKMDRSELEDKFIRMYEENLIIKRYAKKQDDKIKMLVQFFLFFLGGGMCGHCIFMLILYLYIY